VRFRSFQSRLLFFFLGLFLAAQLITITAVDRANMKVAARQIQDQLDATAFAFERLIQERSRYLLRGARALSRDHALAGTVMAGHPETVRSALESLRDRIEADHITLIDAADGETVIGDTDHGQDEGAAYPLARLIEDAEEQDELTAFGHAVRSGELYRVVVTPLLAPAPIAWFGIGFRIDDALAERLRSMTLAQVSFVRNRSGGPPELLATALAPGHAALLPAALESARAGAAPWGRLRLGRDRFVTRVVPLDPDEGIDVILQRSLDEALRPFQPLRTVLLAVSGIGLMLTVAGGVALARRVSRPVRTLVQSARKIEAGDFAHRVRVEQEDEMGVLARAFNGMAGGLEERDRVRSLLGKVVSPDIANELLRSREVELGGELRELTVLFSDLRDFTALSEGRPPQAVVQQLNLYFTRMSEVIERAGGVIDKYVGDAIMALFGAPVKQPDHAGKALRVAVEMSAALDELNARFRQMDLPELDMGVGLHTAVVVAGNMGSPHRLNYTVMGDGVNLAARLEQLTKDKAYSTRVIASEATVRHGGERFRTRSLGAVRVKGKAEAVSIYAIDGFA
jgi:adenylate cyclase